MCLRQIFSWEILIRLIQDFFLMSILTFGERLLNSKKPFQKRKDVKMQLPISANHHYVITCNCNLCSIDQVEFILFQRWIQLSNLWWMPNSVSKGFDIAMKMGSSRRFKRHPTTYRWVSGQLPFTEDQDKP